MRQETRKPSARLRLNFQCLQKFSRLPLDSLTHLVTILAGPPPLTEAARGLLHIFASAQRVLTFPREVYPAEQKATFSRMPGAIEGA